VHQSEIDGSCLYKHSNGVEMVDSFPLHSQLRGDQSMSEKADSSPEKFVQFDSI
jgi:hypothetical protein